MGYPGKPGRLSCWHTPGRSSISGDRVGRAAVFAGSVAVAGSTSTTFIAGSGSDRSRTSNGRLKGTTHETVNAIRARGYRGIVHLEPPPLGPGAAIRGSRDHSLLDGSAAKRGGRHRYSLRISRHLGEPRNQRQAIRLLAEGLQLCAGRRDGLIAWEFMQQSSSSLVFDPHDIGATIIGLFMAWLLFVVLTPLSNATKSW